MNALSQLQPAQSSGSAPSAVRELPDTRLASPLALASANAGLSPTLPRRQLPKLLTCGEVLDKYRIEALLGIGGCAVVYRAMHLLLRVPVALKVVRSGEGWIVRQLLDEARCMARIRHPNVVRIHDVTHGPEATYVAMECVDGRSLSKTIRAIGPLPPTMAVSIAIDVVEGLRAALAQGIIHRDVKPANILMTSNGAAKVVDFGLANLPIVPGGDGQVFGTQGYIAPEQLKDPWRVDFRADIYSLGVTMVSALLGVPAGKPWGDATASRRLPPMLVRLLRDMVAESPLQRPRSYDLLLARLREAYRASLALKTAL